MEKLYLAADSGGSKTKWDLLNGNGEIVFSLETDGLGAVKEGILPIDKTIKEASEILKKQGEIVSVYLSLGGPNTDEVYSGLKKSFDDTPVKVIRESKGDAILYCASYYGCRAVCLLGTGSTAMGYKNGAAAYSGGWGPIYGDGGSGGGLGSSALKSYLRSVDGMEEIGEVKTLFSHLEEGLNIKEYFDRMELKKRALNLTRKEIASLAPKIYALAEKGDKFALELYRREAREIALLANGVIDNKEGEKVLICGGFLKNKPLLLKMCEEEMAKISKAKLVYDENFTPSLAALVAVLKENNIEVTDEMFYKFINGKGE